VAGLRGLSGDEWLGVSGLASAGLALAGLGLSGLASDGAVRLTVAALAGTGREAEMPSANAAPASTDAALRWRLRLRRCRVSTGLNSTGYASNTTCSFLAYPCN